MLGLTRKIKKRSGSPERYRVESRQSLIERFERVSLADEAQRLPEAEQLARVLEVTAQEGWRLVGISEGDFIFRRRR